MIELRRILALHFVGAGAALALGSMVLFAAEGPEPAADPLVALGHRVTSGAAPGYVDSTLCGLCHQDLFLSYQAVAMARSFYRPTPERRVEDFSAPPYRHEPSKRFFRIEPDGDGLIFRRWQSAPDGRPIHELELPVEWILGSGNHARVYLYRTPAGELYQLPLAWYSQANGDGTWAMAPGYDRPEHDGVLRRVRRECMVCHNGYPDVPAESDAFHAAQTFPEELPEGTGCQRCHGPGAEHVRRALAPDGTADAVRAAIVNPARLAPELRDGVCHQCHMQPSVAFPGVRRFGRGDYSFRPGESLDDYRVQTDVREAGRAPGDRFEINHHPFRLEQSRCFEASGRKLSCLTCHDPHRKVAAEERAAHYRAACLTCHEDGACTADHGAAGSVVAPPEDCVTCHMPARRTEDVVHVVMTDHRIVRDAGPPEARLAPREEMDPIVTDLEFLRPERAPEGALAEVYRAVAVVRSGGGGDAAVDHLAANLERARPPEAEPWLQLAQGQIARHRFADAEATLRRVLAREGEPAGVGLQAREWLAIAISGQGRNAEAIAILRAVLAEDPDRPEPRVNLGRLLQGAGEHAEAAGHLRRAVELRPNQVAAWEFLGTALLDLGRAGEAADALRRALALDPGRTRAYLHLADALVAAGDREAALRYLRHGALVAREPEAVRARIEGL